jgi:RHS repeat-associated protein
MGTVKGNQVFPDARTRLYRFTGASFNDGQTPPPAGPTPGDDCGKCADPVSLATGIFTFDATDLYVSDVLPISVTRSYNSRDPEVRPFGRGMTHAYAIFQHSESNFNEADLYLPDGGKIHYARISPPEVPWYLAEFEHTATPTAFYKSTLKMVGGRFHITLKDGTIYIFGHGAPLQAIRDRHGNEITISWSLVNAFDAGTGNITRITSPNGRWIEFTYYAGTNRVYQAKDNIGRTVTYAYDANGNLTSVTDPMNHVTTYTYDASNRMTAIKPPSLQGTQLNLVTNEYTTAADAPTPVGWVKKQTHADSGVYQYTYNVVNGKSSRTDVIDPLGHVRRVEMNPAGYSVEDRRAFGESEEQMIDWERQSGSNFLTSSTDLLDRQTTRTYDDMGNLTSVTRLADTSTPLTTTYTYEPQFNQLATITDPLLHTTTFSYDATGNLVGVTDPLNHTTTMTYNGAGQIKSVTDALQHTFSYDYEGGNLVKVTDQTGAETTRFLDAAGRVLSTTDPLGRTTRYQYDTDGRVTLVTNPLGGTITSTYYPDGQLHLLTDARNNTTEHVYDVMGRLTSRTDPLQGTELYTYDAMGNLSQHVDRKGQVTTRSYDTLGRLQQTVHADGSAVSYGYDVNNRLTTISDSLSGNITRTYDDLDRLTSETTVQGSVSYTYDDADRRATMTVAGQPSVVYEHDDANRLSSVTQGSASVSLTYDNANRRSTLTLPNGIVVSYGYNDASRVTSLTYTSGSTVLGDLTYVYDLAGRRVQTGGTWARTSLPQPVSASYDAANRITQWGGTTYAYDPNGALSSDGVTSYTWGPRNQLVGTSGAVSSSFQYDGYGRRTAKTSAAGSIAFLYDGLTQVQQIRSGGPNTNFLTGSRIDEYFERTGPSVATYLVDALGSSIALSDAAGAIQTHYTYDPFGDTTVTGPETMNTVAFTGRDFEVDSSQYYYRARYYDPGLGRFLSEDPFGFKGGYNLHSYVNNDPVNSIDPLGLVAWTCRFLVATANNYAGPGAGAFLANCTSECVAGERVRAKLAGSIVGSSVGLLLGGFATSDIVLNDGARVPDPHNLEGLILYASVGFVPGVGASYSWLHLGAAKGQGGGLTVGLDAGADIYTGAAALTSSKKENCCPQ